MRLFDNPLIGLVIMASIIIMAFTALLLWVQARPEVPADQVDTVDPTQLQEQPAETAAAPLDSLAAGPVSETTMVEGEVIFLETNPEERLQRLDAIQPRPLNPTQVPADGSSDIAGESNQVTIVESDQGSQVDQSTAETQGQVAGDTGQSVQTATPTLPSVADSTVVDPIIFELYIVQPGDTLYSIARAFNTAVESMAENGISSADLIAGNQINIPRPNPNYCPGLEKYVVSQGDTVFGIARRYGRTIEALQATNNLDAAYTIKIGQVLCIP